MPNGLAMPGGNSVSAESSRENLKQDTTEYVKVSSPSPTQKIRKNT